MDRIVLFDGVCNFCNGAVNFIIDHDKKRTFRFAPLQSRIGKEMHARSNIAENVDSLVLVEGDRAYFYSTAALKIARQLDGVMPLLYAFIIVPAVVRDPFYRLFAKYRYRLFGRRDACMIPTADVRERFLA